MFERLARAPSASEDAKGRLRMDALPGPPAETLSPSPEPSTEKPTAPAAVSLAHARATLPQASAMNTPHQKANWRMQGSSSEVAAELRQIRETLARMQAEKARAVSSVVASANARRVVLHNVHFSANPDILRAHFSGCGPVVSAVIDKDPAGNPRGTAVIEFEEESQRKTALTLSGISCSFISDGRNQLISAKSRIMTDMSNMQAHCCWDAPSLSMPRSPRQATLRQLSSRERPQQPSGHGPPRQAERRAERQAEHLSVAEALAGASSQPFP